MASWKLTGKNQLNDASLMQTGIQLTVSQVNGTIGQEGKDEFPFAESFGHHIWQEGAVRWT